MALTFTQDFIHAIERLRLLARQVPAGGRHAEHRSRAFGSGMEFRDFRSYAPGDDVRRVDWNLYRRSGRLFLRLFEEPEDLAVYCLLDMSDSMFFEDPPRADAARQMAAVLCGVALNQLDRAGVYPFGADLGRPLGPTSGRQSLTRVLRYLEGLQPAGPTDLARSLHRFGTLRLRNGLAVVISDFFDPRGIEAVIDALRGVRHKLLLVQVVRGSDAAPAVSGELRVVDCESGAAVDVTVTARGLEDYRRAYRAFNDRLMDFVARRRAAYLKLDADRPVLEQVRHLFVDGVLMT
ncbi:MAG: DUF58 domain-containing protein [Phycisphaerae bacterium]|jgi:uncharacterized protein (DUF58 family)